MPIPFIMPKMDMDQEEVTINEWLKNEGDFVMKGEPVIIVETDKITSEVEAPATGKLARLLYHSNDVAPVTQVVAYILEEGETEADLPQENVSQPGEDQKVQAAGSAKNDPAIFNTKASDENDIKTRVETPATPAARRLASENRLELKTILGSGPGGRVQAVDVENFIAEKSEQKTPLTKTHRAGDTQALSSMRKQIAERLTTSYQSTPHIYLTAEVDMHKFEARLKHLNKIAEDENLPKISLTAYLATILADCLKRHPYLNASLIGENITFWDEVNIGIATSIDNGLIVPVIHRADRLSINELNQKIKFLTQRAREGSITREEIQGGTFTISNLGMYGIQSFTSIINPPQSAILSVGAVKRRPVVVDAEDSINVRPMMMMTLAADHRLIDGVVAANFLVDLIKSLENPN